MKKDHILKWAQNDFQKTLLSEKKKKKKARCVFCVKKIQRSENVHLSDYLVMRKKYKPQTNQADHQLRKIWTEG